MNTEIDQTPSLPVGPNVVPSTLKFPVVGIGASAGGIPALLQFFSTMPADNGMAFVVIMHLSPKHESNLDNVLQKATKMSVMQVVQPTMIEKNHVYVISPAHHLAMSDSYLRIDSTERPHGRRIAIDLFFRTLADTHRERSVAIVFSGSGSDGSVGLARVKEQGGIAIAQQPDEAEYDSMPHNAINTGLVDFVLPVEEMAEKLLELARVSAAIKLPSSGDPTIAALPPESEEDERTAEQALREVLVTLHTRTGHDFRSYKRATVLRRIERRMQVNGKHDLQSYRDFLNANADETPALLRDMLIGVTNFFRDREAFDVLERTIVPQLFESNVDNEQIRVWVAGCATGEEAYSLAMLLIDRAELGGKPSNLQIFASDIDAHAIGIGRAGVYPESIVTDIPPQRLRQFFIKEQTQYRIKKEVRERVLFAEHNLLRDPPFSKLHLISCRNLLIYLDRDAQTEVLEMFHFALRPGGYLFLGSSESADAVANYFVPIDKKNRIYQAKPIPSTNRNPLPMGVLDRQTNRIAEQPVARNKFSLAELHQRVLEQYAPPSVIVNYESNIVHMSERAGRFLRYTDGEPTYNLVTLVQPELRLELRTALFQAIQSGKSIEARPVRIQRDDKHYYVNMTVRPILEKDGGNEFVLVLFDEVEDSMGDARSEMSGKDSVLVHLEQELQRTKEQLQATIEQSETSTEELKASNEELQAINEELRSTTEELETSKEELQSINEELITVNHELKSKVEETAKVNDDLQNLIASTDIATVFVDRAMRIKRFTPRATDIFSIIPTDIGRSLLDITHRLQYDTLADDAAEAFESLKLIEREVRSEDGHWYIARFWPYRTMEDRIEGAVMTFIDITGRRQAEEDLRIGQERLRVVAETTKDYAIITFDDEGRITSWNNGAERIFGHQEEDVIGQSGDLLFPQEELARGLFQSEMRYAREKGRAEEEGWLVGKDGRRIYCSGIITPLKTSNSQGFAKILRDITQRKLAEQEQEELLRRERQTLLEAQTANHLKDEFMAVMSHELKNPLNLIMIHAELLSRLPEAKQSPEIVKVSNTIRRSVLTQARIIDDLLDLSRVHTGKLKIERAPVDVAALARNMVQVMNGESSKMIIADTPGESLYIHGDAVRVEQIVWNLLSNALKFTEDDGRVQVEVAQEDGFVRIGVSDNGKGIAPNALDKIFDMFQQDSSFSNRRKGGLGIGLALVKELAELHGGRVAAHSDGLGQGARFDVWLPVYQHSEVISDDGGQAQSGRLHGMNILMVDDAVDTLDAFAILLETEGAVVETANGGIMALRLAGSRRFDLVISDIGMPGLDGYQLLEQLRQLASYADVPVIAMTGFGRPNEIKRSLEAGFAAHLPKPVSLASLIDAVQNIGLID